MSSRYFWLGLFRDVENVVKSFLICARIHSTINYRNMKLVIAVYPFQITSLDTGCITYGNDSKFYFVVSVDLLLARLKLEFGKMRHPRK